MPHRFGLPMMPIVRYNYVFICFISQKSSLPYPIFTVFTVSLCFIKTNIIMRQHLYAHLLLALYFALMASPLYSATPQQPDSTDDVGALLWLPRISGTTAHVVAPTSSDPTSSATISIARHEPSSEPGRVAT